MRVMCIWCEDQGLPSVLREQEPLDDDTVARGLCDRHALQLVNEVRRALLSRSLIPVEALRV